MPSYNPFNPESQINANDQNNIFTEPDINAKPNNSGYIPMTQVQDMEHETITQVAPVSENTQSQKTYVQAPPVAPQPARHSTQLDADYTNKNNQPVQSDAGNLNTDFLPKGFEVIQGRAVAEEVIEKSHISSPMKQKKSKKPFNFKEYFKKKWYVVIFGAALIFSLIVGTVAFFLLRKGPDNNPYNNIDVSINAPITSPSGSPSNWTIEVENKEDVAIDNILVKLNFDSAFTFQKAINPQPSKADGSEYTIARLDGAGKGVSKTLISFEGVLTGEIDEVATIDGNISYAPTPLRDTKNSRKELPISKVQTKIVAPEIKVEIKPERNKVENGGQLGVDIVFENLSDRELRDLQFEVNYPTNNAFQFDSGTLAVQNSVILKQPTNGNNMWKLDKLPRLQEGKIRLEGLIQAADGVELSFEVTVSIRNNEGVYQPLSKNKSVVTATSQALVVNTFIEGRTKQKSFASGEELTFIVEFQNRGTTTLRGVEILAAVDDPANLLDYSTIKFVGGDNGNVNNNAIQWRAANNPQLENVTPNTKGTFKFNIKAKAGDKFINQNFTQTQYTLKPRAEARASNADPAFSTGDLYRASSDLEFEQKITEKGACTNQANCKIYTVSWFLKNRQNVVNDVTVSTRSALPVDSWSQDSIKPGAKNNQIKYNPVNGEIAWSVGVLPSYTGIATGPSEISFEIKIVSNNQKEVEMFQATTIRGVDDVTGQIYQKTGPKGTAGRN
jgi:hypothetical protein